MPKLWAVCNDNGFNNNKNVLGVFDSKEAAEKYAKYLKAMRGYGYLVKDFELNQTWWYANYYIRPTKREWQYDAWVVDTYEYDEYDDEYDDEYEEVVIGIYSSQEQAYQAKSRYLAMEDANRAGEPHVVIKHHTINEPYDYTDEEYRRNKGLLVNEKAKAEKALKETQAIIDKAERDLQIEKNLMKLRLMNPQSDEKATEVEKVMLKLFVQNLRTCIQAPRDDYWKDKKVAILRNLKEAPQTLKNVRFDVHAYDEFWKHLE
jgi:hypothetical protein